MLQLFSKTCSGGKWLGLSGHRRLPIPAVVQQHGKMERISTCVEARVKLQAKVVVELRRQGICDLLLHQILAISPESFGGFGLLPTGHNHITTILQVVLFFSCIVRYSGL